MALKPNPNECWKNALMVTRDHPGAVYVEGWAVTKRSYLTIEHGWLELGGEVIEPTIPGEIDKYFPGLRFIPEQAFNLLMGTKSLPLVWHLLDHLSKDQQENYRQACDEALAYCAEKVKQSKP